MIKFIHYQILAGTFVPQVQEYLYYAWAVMKTVSSDIVVIVYLLSPNRSLYCFMSFLSLFFYFSNFSQIVKVKSWRNIAPHFSSKACGKAFSFEGEYVVVYLLSPNQSLYCFMSFLSLFFFHTAA